MNEEKDNHKYLVLATDTLPYYAEAKNIHDLIIKFAEYCGEKSDLFLLAIELQHDIEILVKMFNHFSTFTQIETIYEIDKTIYNAHVQLMEREK